MFSDVIKSLRTQKGLSQTQLAREIGVSPGNIGDWEIGRSKPGYAALAALSRFFEVPADELLELTPQKTENRMQQRTEDVGTNRTCRAMTALSRRQRLI